MNKLTRGDKQECVEIETELRSGRRPRASWHSGETKTTGPCTILNKWSNSNWHTCYPGLFIRLQLVSFAVWEGILGAAGSAQMLQSHSHTWENKHNSFSLLLSSASASKKQNHSPEFNFNTILIAQCNIIELRTDSNFQYHFKLLGTTWQNSWAPVSPI